MRLTLLLLTFLAVSAVPARGAIPGDIGDESTSSFTITLALQPTLEISTATDITINIDDRDADVVYRQPFCVRGTINSRFTVTAYGDTGQNGDFILRGADSELLPFSLAYYGNPKVPGSSVTLEDGVPSNAFQIFPLGSDCNGQTYFVVTFDAEDLSEAGSGLYSGSLTFLVSPV